MPSIPILDIAVLDKIVQDTGTEVLPLLFDSFSAESGDWIKTINQAVLDKDSGALEFGTHSLGSTALSLGVLALGEMSRKMEHLCLKGELEQAIKLHPQLLELVNDSYQALEQFKQTAQG